MSKDSRRIVSAGQDNCVRVWARTGQFEQRILPHPTPVRAVACTPRSAAGNWCLSGGGDGIGRLWDLDDSSDAPLRELKDGHRGEMTCVAFSPDGAWCATGGDDRAVCLWNSSNGSLKYRFPEEHRGPHVA